MQNFTVHFQYPWLLLLLIPAFALTFFLYFRLNKKYRKTRNRIVSIVLHLTVMTLAIFALSGIGFSYTVTNLENEIILLVDVSDTEEQSKQLRDEFVRTVVEESGYDHYKVGIVTFGFTQEYVVPLTYETGDIYERYLDSLSSALPDTSATDIAAALRFTRPLFENPETAKIVLITDGKETDESATDVVRPIAAQGIRVDTVYVSSDYQNDKMQIVGVEYPEYHLVAGEEFQLNVTVKAKTNVQSPTIRLYDNGTEITGDFVQPSAVAAGEQIFTFNVTFAERGLHELLVRAAVNADGLEQNNEYRSNYYLEVFNHVLIIEQESNASDALCDLLTADDQYSVDVLNLKAPAFEIPTTLEELQQYDQIILNNISNSDLVDLGYGLDRLLNSYVYEIGGGLFTVGGKEADGETAHSYNREDMYNTLFQQMLPVQVIDYKPPVGVMVIIDISGSMGRPDSPTSPLHYAKEGAIACLSALQERDYIGVMTLDQDYSVVLPLTRRTEETIIKEAINSVPAGTSTIYTDAIKTAGERLLQLQDVDKRHIIIVSDGMPSNDDTEYFNIARDFYVRQGITLSVVGVGIADNSTPYNDMKKLTDACGGTLHRQSNSEIVSALKNDLEAPTITEYKEEPFYPIVENALSPLLNGVTYGQGENSRTLDVELGGFYGAKRRESAEIVLKGDYEVPIYAQWKYGNGMVGSFMCDLKGGSESLAGDFMNDPNGQRFLMNVVANLMPLTNIRPSQINYDLSEGNYMNTLSVYPNPALQDGEWVRGKIVYTEDGEEKEVSLNELPEETDGENIYVTLNLSEANSYSRCTFVVKKSGIYKIVLEKLNAAGEAVSSVEFYKSFSYSMEYDSMSEDDPGVLLAEIAEKGEGAVLSAEDPWGVFEGFVPALLRTYDPRLALMITAMVLFLLDIAVRKFKFKWIHEIVREHKAKKTGGKS